MSSNKSARTRSKVLEVAKELFNERGTAAVSTNHIAAAAGISPGNLYYHFKDKQEIIRQLFDQYTRELGDRWKPEKDANKNLATLAKNLTVGVEWGWEYRFFNRELMVLLRADEKLRTAYETVFQRRTSELRAFAEQLVWQDMMRVPRLPRTLDDLIMAVWLIADGWHSFLELTADPKDPTQFARVNDLLMVLVEPYLTAEGRELLEEQM